MLAGIASGLFTALIFLEARNIRQVEWFAKASGNWQDFNRLVMEQGASERWADLRSGRVPWARVAQVDLFLIYAYLNVLVFEFQANRRGLLNRRYATKSIFDNLLYFRPLWSELLPHLRANGWPSDFLDAADRHIRKAAPASTEPTAA